MSPLGWPKTDELDATVEAFESAWLDGGMANFDQFLPVVSHPQYWEIAAELMRVDMELRLNNGELRGLESYCSVIPGLASNMQALEQVAYEEYRLRAARGEQVTPEDYADRYEISTKSWKRFVARATSPIQHSDRSSFAQSMPAAWSNALELADEIAEFPECGSEFSGFLLEQEIGRGAFARVYLARQGQLADRRIVLKIAAGSSVEPQHLARLQHTHIVPIYSVHKVGRLTAVCMPYLGRQTLADFVSQLNAQSELPDTGRAFLSTVKAHADDTCVDRATRREEAPQESLESSRGPTYTLSNQMSNLNYRDAVTRIVLQIAEGLRHAHQRGILHRDLKPANILLTDDGNALILDFNLSTEVVVNGATALAVGGTLPYMAPEHLEALVSGRAIDFRSDIFSLGVVFFELLTGKKPFPNRKGSLETVVEQMLEDRRGTSPTEQFLVSSDPDIAAIISRCLAAQLKDRYQSVGQLHEDLTRHLADLPLRHAANTSLLHRWQKWSRRHPRLSSAGAISALAGTLLAAVTWFAIRLTAENSYRQFVNELPSARAALSIAEEDSDLIRYGIDQVQSQLATYGVDTNAHWHRPLSSWALKPQEDAVLEHGLSELSYQIADGYSRVANLEHDRVLVDKAAAWNSLALSLVPPEEAPLEYMTQRSELQKAQGDSTVAQESNSPKHISEHSGSLNEFLAARQLVFSRDFARALPRLLKLRTERPQDPVIWLLLGDAYAGRGELARADECFSTVIALLPRSYLALYNRGRCRADLRQFELAIDDYTAALRLNPDFPACLLNRALAHAAAGNHAAAIEDFTTALDRGAPYTRIYFLRARSYANLGNSTAAAKDRETGLKLEPRDEESWIARGIARIPHDPHGAMADFERALAQNPRSVTALQNVVHVNAEIFANYDGALAALNSILQIDPQNADALAGRAVLNARLGNDVEALADLEEVLRLPSQPRHLLQTACALSLMSEDNTKKADDALQFLTKALALDPRLRQRAQSDPDLANIRELDGYKALLAEPKPPALTE